MNPNENNPMSPAGASGVAGSTPGATSSSSVPGAIDFTGGSSLSMNDSLASAQDNLTSAGQAVNSTSSTMGLDQLGSNSPSASMETPDAPLTPADPVPGSIGSVTSIPPLKSAENTNTFTPPTTSAMPVMGGGAPAASSNASTTPQTSGAGYFNPFATRNNSAANTTSAQSSTAVPPALQQQNEKFSNPLGAQKAPKAKSSLGNIVMIIAWAVAVIAAVLAVFFFIQWQDAEKRANEKEIVYIPAPEPDDGGDDVSQASTIKCTQYLGGEGIEGVEGIIDHNRAVTVTYMNEDGNNNLDNIVLIDDYNFTDGAAAEAARWYFDGQVTSLGDIAAGLGVDPLVSNVEINDNVLHYTISGDAPQIIGENASMFLIDFDEAGTAMLDPESVQNTYVGKGFACVAE